MKKLFKFFLPACILLCSGYLRISGHTLAEADQDSAFKYSGEATLSFFCLDQDGQQSAINSLSSDFEKNGLGHAAKIEEKEDELQSFRKYLDPVNHLGVAGPGQPSFYFHHNTHRLSIADQYFAYIPYRNALFIRLGVLRI